MRQLLLSSSRVGDSAYLQSALEAIKSFSEQITGKVVFVPYAAVTMHFDSYYQMVVDALKPIGIQPEPFHMAIDKPALLDETELLIVGGGNTFALLQRLQQESLLELIKRRCFQGMSYIGWSAGSNICAPTICTTNDMPIVQPQSFKALELLPFQINPHYLHGNPPGHHGETRQQRLEEYLQLNPNQTVVALPEGCWLLREATQLTYCGSQPGLLFRHNQSPLTLKLGSDLNHLLMSPDDRQ